MKGAKLGNLFELLTVEGGKGFADTMEVVG
jgi:hypothetical protein